MLSRAFVKLPLAPNLGMRLAPASNIWRRAYDVKYRQSCFTFWSVAQVGTAKQGKKPNGAERFTGTRTLKRWSTIRRAHSQFVKDNFVMFFGLVGLVAFMPAASITTVD